MALTYWNVLEAAKNALAGVGVLAGVEAKIRPEVAFVKSEDTSFPLLLVCPRRDRWEQASDPETYMAGDGSGGAMVGYPVLVAVIIANRFDQEQLRFQLDARDQIRKRLWDNRRFRPSVTTAWDVRYEPNPRGVDLSALAVPLDVSLQEFTIGSLESRASA